MFPMTKFYDMAALDFANSFKFLDELDTKYSGTEKDFRVKTTEDGLEFSVDVPGVRPEDLSINVLGRELTIQGKLRGKTFVKKYTLSKHFDLTTAKATHEYGVLTLNLKKNSESKPTEIQINVKNN